MLADDLTGACDAGVAFALAGFPATVVWREDAAWPESPKMLVISTETRASGECEARQKVERICRRLSDRTVVYKKIDSVLRGPVEAEVRAVMEACGFSSAVVCPALPEQGRVVRGGRVYVHGELLEAALPGGGGIVTPDAEDLPQLEVIASELAARIGETLAVGSAGLALAMTALLGRVHPKPPPVSQLPAALVVGSHHAATLAQLDYLRGALDIPETNLAALESLEHDAYAAVVMREVDESAFIPLGRAVAQGRVGALIATGGATARVMLDGMGARGIELCGEVERGVPWGRVLGGLADGALLITKSGGFGAPDCLWRAWRAIRPESNA